jgi:hypothetical protein
MQVDFRDFEDEGGTLTCARSRSGTASNWSVIVTSHHIAEYRHTPLWAALESAIAELAASHELSVNTAPDYVIEYLCRELIAKKLVISSADLK